VKRFGSTISARSVSLDELITDIRAGIWTIPGVVFSDLAEVFPVIALLHPLPQFLATYNEFQEAWRGFLANRIGPPLIPDVQLVPDEEFEILGPHIGRAGALADIVRSRASTQATAAISLKNFLLTTLEWNEQVNPAMHALFAAATTSARDQVLTHFNLT
jgi:hypothetical protein